MATAIEYGLIAAGISVAIIAVVQGLGPKLGKTLEDVQVAFGGRIPSAPPAPPAKVLESGWMTIHSQLTTRDGRKSITVGAVDARGVVQPLRTFGHTCQRPKIDREKNRVYTVLVRATTRDVGEFAIVCID